MAGELSIKMRMLAVYTVLYVIAGLGAAPASEDHEDVVPKGVFLDSFIKYKAEYDIVDIMVPMNAINFAASDSSESESEEFNLKDLTVFFVVADDKDGKREDKGLYRYKKGDSKMILATGRSSTASSNNNKLVFFAASDGLYVYNTETDSADKYGPITDAIRSIATDETGATIYIVTDDHKLYKVTNNGENKELVDDVDDVVEIVLDNVGNLYYYNTKKEVYIKTSDKIIKADNLPADPKVIKAIRPPFIIYKTVPMSFDDTVYIVHSNGRSENLGFRFAPDATPTAFGPEAVHVQYYALDKKLYEFNIKEMKENDVFHNVREKTEKIRNQANKSKHTLGAKKD
ncbi:hypothetical protein KGM_212549 [Danaus plexippus plexippus]|uniref:Uncharacterized protein n=1 Tax=Danaus plexippus plexippus TaxID=278856 RepID=A0A212FFS7_DANPL|nr:hypothetical protein KGM_212549 [Danaus plexippus plexippus]